MNTAVKQTEITGIGVITPIGTGIDQFAVALRNGKTNFSILELTHADQLFSFPGAFVNNFYLNEQLRNLELPVEIINKVKKLRNISQSTAYSVYCTMEAWLDSDLGKSNIDHERIAIVSGGSNIQQGMLTSIQQKHSGNLQFLNPSYGLNFFDTDVIGVLSELLDIKGEGHSIGAASASGNMSIIQGHRLLQLGLYDAVIVIAPLMDISIFEYQAFTSMGAMAVLQPGLSPSTLCRPFDMAHSGFLYGQSAGCVILESSEHAIKRGKRGYGSVAGYGVSMDANRNPNPSAGGEKDAMVRAMYDAGIDPRQIDYVNTHGTASVSGDDIEVEALLLAGLKHVKANSTKSLTGHSLSAAGLVEVIATVIQIKEGFLHPVINLVNPITNDISWITGTSEEAAVNYGMSNSFGFGGINTSVIIKEGSARDGNY